MRIWPGLLAACILAVGFLTTTASADTVYTFSGTDSNGAIGFQLSVPTFVNQLPGTTFASGQFTFLHELQHWSACGYFYADPIHAYFF